MYIQNNFTKKLRLQDIAKQFGYDYSYLSSFFNKILTWISLHSSTNTAFNSPASC